MELNKRGTQLHWKILIKLSPWSSQKFSALYHLPATRIWMESWFDIFHIIVIWSTFRIFLFFLSKFWLQNFENKLRLWKYIDKHYRHSKLNHFIEFKSRFDEFHKILDEITWSIKIFIVAAIILHISHWLLTEIYNSSKHQTLLKVFKINNCSNFWIFSFEEEGLVLQSRIIFWIF